MPGLMRRLCAPLRLPDLGDAHWSLLALGFVLGACTALAAPALLKLALLKTLRRVLLVDTTDTTAPDPCAGPVGSGRGGKIYALHHAVLNLSLPPAGMWMNMGYWKTLDSSASRLDAGTDTLSFPQACENLLVKVLQNAGILAPTKDQPSQIPSGRTAASLRRKLRILDVGFGCGDQSLFLTDLLSTAAGASSSTRGNHAPTDAARGEYIGITIDPQQHAYATQRLSTMPREKGCAWQLFCADGADPSSWPGELVRALHSPSVTTSSTTSSTTPAAAPAAAAATCLADVDSDRETWVLGLDCLYHLRPSRASLFNHAARDLRASIAAFDLILPNPPTQHGRTTVPSRASWWWSWSVVWHRLILRLLSSLLNVPFANFLTEDEYRAQLVRAGYRSSSISVEDISDDVFRGLAAYIERRSEHVSTYILPSGRGAGRGGQGLGPLKAYTVFAWLLRWWARTGVVRGVVVVARRSQ